MTSLRCPYAHARQTRLWSSTTFIKRNQTRAAAAQITVGYSSARLSDNNPGSQSGTTNRRSRSIWVGAAGRQAAIPSTVSTRLLAGATRIKRLRDMLGNQMVSELLIKNIARKGYMLAIEKGVIRLI